MKKPGRLTINAYQRQKIARRTIIALSLMFVVSSLVLTFLFNISSKKTSAYQNGIHVVVVDDQEFTTEKSIPAPVVKTLPPAGSKMIYIKKVKPLQNITPSN